MNDDALKQFHARFDKWALQIGLFILWFGGIEQDCARLWMELRPDEKIPTGQRRIDGIVKDLKKLDNTAELLQALEQVLILMDLRNDIAHNTVSTEVYELHDGTVDSCCVIEGPTSRYRLGLEQLEILVEEARALASETSSAFHTFMRHRYENTAT